MTQGIKKFLACTKQANNLQVIHLEEVCAKFSKSVEGVRP